MKKKPAKVPRNGSALAAKMRKGGPMKHRLEPKKGAKNKQAEILEDMVEDKDVHTEHCCKKHGCKYYDDACSVETGIKKQSYPCEACQYDKIEDEQEAQVLIGFMFFLRNYNRKPGVLSANEIREIVAEFQKNKDVWVDDDTQSNM